MAPLTKVPVVSSFTTGTLPVVVQRNARSKSTDPDSLFESAIPAGNGTAALLLFVSYLLPFMRILLSGDVENKPGPDSVNKKIQEAVAKIGNTLTGKMSFLEAQVAKVLQAVQAQSETIKSQAESACPTH